MSRSPCPSRWRPRTAPTQGRHAAQGARGVHATQSHADSASTSSATEEHRPGQRDTTPDGPGPSALPLVPPGAVDTHGRRPRNRVPRARFASGRPLPHPPQPPCPAPRPRRRHPTPMGDRLEASAPGFLSATPLRPLRDGSPSHHETPRQVTPPRPPPPNAPRRAAEVPPRRRNLVDDPETRCSSPAHPVHCR